MSRKPVKLGTWEMLRPHDEEGITDYSDVKQKDSPSLQTPQSPRVGGGVQGTQK